MPSLLKIWIKKIIEKVTKDLDSKKSALQNDIPCKIPTFNGTYN